MDLLTGLDWGVIAAIIVALAAIAGLILQFSRRERPWKKTQDEHNVRLTTIEIKIDNHTDSMNNLRHMVEEHDQRDQKDFERVESKIEKLTDLMIDMIGQKSVPPKARKK